MTRITRFIAADNPVAVTRIARELLLAGDSLAVFPRRGRPARQVDTREVDAVGPYILVYRLAGTDSVTILRVWHAAQNR